MRTACPLSSGIELTSARTEPPLLRIGSTSIGFVVSNTSHTVSARRNRAAGVTVVNAKVRRRPSLSRLALTLAALPPVLAADDASDAAGDIFGGTVTAGARISLARCPGLSAP